MERDVICILCSASTFSWSSWLLVPVQMIGLKVVVTDFCEVTYYVSLADDGYTDSGQKKLM